MGLESPQKTDFLIILKFLNFETSIIIKEKKIIF